MDEGGWKVLKPFRAATNVPYRILLGDDLTVQGYGVQDLPDTFLVDQQGRLAAAYVAALVDKENLNANVRALLSEH
jgi:hypothetical protein